MCWLILLFFRGNYRVTLIPPVSVPCPCRVTPTMNSALTVDFSTCRACQGPHSAAEHLLILPLPSTWLLFIFLQLMLPVFYDSSRFCTHKNSQEARSQGMLRFLCLFFFADCHHQEFLWPLMQPSTLFPAEHRPLYLSYNQCCLQGHVLT